MKHLILSIMICLVAVTATYAQTWAELTEEEKIMKLEDFRADNQKFLADSLGMTETQMNDIDNVNICYLATLDRIDRYGADEATKNELAEFLTDARWAQLDVIMGEENHKRYYEYVKAKIDKERKAMGVNEK